MKRITLLLGLLLSAGVMAQEVEKPKFDYNKWSIDLGAGMNKPLRPMKSGHYTKTPDFLTGHVGVRYMFNDKFGLRANVMYNKFEDASKSLDFESELWSYGLEGVVNIGNVLEFGSWTNTFGLLGHIGGSYSTLKGKKPLKSSTDAMGTITAGLTPQVRLGNRVALFVDVSMHGNIRQDLTFDGQGSRGSLKGFDGYYMTTTAGLNIYLGKHGKHADWHYEASSVNEELDRLENRLAQLEEEINNLDTDFVLPEYLNQDNLDTRYLNNNGASGEEAMKALMTDGYVNVFFKFDKVDVEDWSVQWVHYAYQYLKNNDDATVTLYGYADEIGNGNYNEKLSQRRADKIKNVLVSLGIDASRITTEGKGVDASVDKSDADARKFMRRVNFELN